MSENIEYLESIIKIEPEEFEIIDQKPAEDILEPKWVERRSKWI